MCADREASQPNDGNANTRRGKIRNTTRTHTHQTKIFNMWYVDVIIIFMERNWKISHITQMLSDEDALKQERESERDGEEKSISRRGRDDDDDNDFRYIRISNIFLFSASLRLFFPFKFNKSAAAALRIPSTTTFCFPSTFVGSLFFVVVFWRLLGWWHMWQFILGSFVRCDGITYVCRSVHSVTAATLNVDAKLVDANILIGILSR